MRLKLKMAGHICKILMAGLLLAAVLNIPTAAEEQTTGTVFTNGNIYTVDKDFSRVSILAVQGQRLVYVGDDPAAARKLAGPTAKIVDLGGKTVIPGLIDGHMHFLLEGEQLSALPIALKSKQDILDLVRAEAARLKPGEWITGDGWNQEVWADKGWPGKEELDEAAPDNPVVLGRVDRHSVWVNSSALAAAGITKDTPDPQGGEILKNARGEVLGILTDTAARLITDKIPPLGEARRYQALLKAQEELFSYGITSIVDAGQSLENVELMRKGYAAGDLRLRVYVMLNASDNQDTAYLEAGYKPEREMYDHRLSVAAVKIFGDGALGSRSAWLLESYTDRAGHKGNGRYTDAELYALLRRARDEGMQVGVHAIGDAAVRQCLEVMERVLKERPLVDHRYRIEHFQVARPEDIARAVHDGIIPAMQSVHAASDLNMAENRLGGERIRASYAWRGVIAAGGIIANGSDAPVEPVNPYHGFYAAVARKNLSGEPQGGWYPEQKMSRAEALKSFTIWAAYAQFEEKLKGSLEAGKLADFVVLDRDIMLCPESDIKDARALLTVVGGRVEYAAE